MGLIMDERMAKLEVNIEHISNDIKYIKKLLKTQGDKITVLEKMKYRLEGMGIVLSTGVVGLAIKVFFFDVHY